MVEMEDDRTWKEKALDKVYELLFDWECSPGWYRFAHYVELFIMDAFVDLFITLCIVGNTAFMACDHADITPQFAKILNIGNNVSYIHFDNVLESVCACLMTFRQRRSFADGFVLSSNI